MHRIVATPKNFKRETVTVFPMKKGKSLHSITSTFQISPSTSKIEKKPQDKETKKSTFGPRKIPPLLEQATFGKCKPCNNSTFSTLCICKNCESIISGYNQQLRCLHMLEYCDECRINQNLSFACSVCFGTYCKADCKAINSCSHETCFRCRVFCNSCGEGDCVSCTVRCRECIYMSCPRCCKSCKYCGKKICMSCYERMGKKDYICDLCKSQITESYN